MSDNTRKQIYLKENILDAGYNPNEFAIYMMSLKEDGTNISVWTLEELEDIVNSFIKIQSQKQPISENDSYKETSPTDPYSQDRDNRYNKRDKENESPEPYPNNQNYGYDSGSEDDDRNLNNDNYGSKEPSDPTSERKYDYDDYNRESSENKDQRAKENEEDLRNRGVAPLSFEEQEAMQIKHGMSFFSEREAIMKAAEEGRHIEYYHEEQNQEEIKQQESQKPTIELKQPAENESDSSKISKGSNEEEEKEKGAKDKNETELIGFKIPKNPLCEHQDLVCRVFEPQIHDDGFFTSKYVTYQVRIESLNLDVRRKDKHFAYLYDFFCKVCPYIMIPTIPDVQKDKKLDLKYLAKRATYLEDFLNKSLQSDDLKMLPLFYDFFKDPDRKKFSKYIKSTLEKTKKPTCVKEFFTTSGSHIIDSNKHIINFSDNLSLYLNVYETCCNKFNDYTKKLASQMLDTSKTLTELGECSKYMSKMYKLCNNKQFAKLYTDTSFIYFSYNILLLCIQNTFDRWSTTQNNQTKIISHYLSSFYSIPTLHLSALKRLDNVKQSYQTQFEKSNINLEKKKEKAFAAKNTSTWELSIDDIKRTKDMLEDKVAAFKAMFPRESLEVTNLKNSYYFVANKCYHEIRRVNRYHMFNTAENFVKLSQKSRDLTKEYNEIWNDFEAKYDKSTFPIEIDDYFNNQSSNEGISTPKGSDDDKAIL